jgi:DNA polymerase I-like protein with 3'-5' exonuclease and polymerase domains
MAFIEIDRRLNEVVGSEDGLILQMHDGLVAEVAVAYADKAMQIFKEELEKPRQIFGHTVVLPCELEMGTHWGSMEKLGKEKQSE